METTETASALPETVHRSPHSFEVVEPVSGDKRKTKAHVDRLTAARKVHSVCDSSLLFVNSELIDHPVTEAAATDPDRLFNATEDNPPNFAILHEKAEHRIIVYLKSQGLSNKEIAEKTGYTNSWICQIVRQPWFRLRLVHELKTAGIDAVQATVRAAALDSVFTLIELRDDVTAPKAVRKACSDSLLDRYLGKPTQKIESEEKRLPSSPEISAINTELAEIDKELNPPDAVQH